MADYSELKRKAQEIRNEVKAGANTASRVGLVIEELVNALEAEEHRATEAEKRIDTAKQNTLTKYFEQETSAGVSFKKDETTHSGVQVSANQALVYYKQGSHIDRIVASENEHINITSSDENGGNVSQVLVRPDEINLRDGNGKGYINIKGTATVISSTQSETGLRSMVRATDEQLWLMHYPEEKDGEASKGIGIVIGDTAISFYSELEGYVTPLIINKDGTIFMRGVSSNLATYIKSLEARIANLEAHLTNTTKE